MLQLLFLCAFLLLTDFSHFSPHMQLQNWAADPVDRKKATAREPKKGSSAYKRSYSPLSISMKTLVLFSSTCTHIHFPFSLETQVLPYLHYSPGIPRVNSRNSFIRTFFIKCMNSNNLCFPPHTSTHLCPALNFTSTSVQLQTVQFPQQP